MRNILSFLLLLPLAAIHAQTDEVNITIDKLGQNTYMLTGSGGNIGIYVGEDKVFMVDDQFAPLSEKIKTTIGTLTDKPISYLVNTHMHGDHTGGNVNFNTNETVLVAQDNVRKRLQVNGKEKVSANEMNQQDYEKTLPEITFSEDMTFHDGDETVMLFHVHNAHTDGDTMIYFMNENVIHMGDTYFAGRYPYIDLNSGGSINGYIEAHKKALLVIDSETKIIPGHGRPSNKAELETFVSVLEDVRAIIQQEISAGKSLEEVKSNQNLTSKYDADYGTGFINPERMRETVYLSLTSPIKE
ncbi:MBL fold metallo-hydrolase [Flagellimonas zhangzhouensis]|uniref:Glyoxylase, beta-lactamase superfamily II n=1 Tax=Flagellimonas zhangzhouensis TaxID=1073328 RepID=A0A1H2X139_9FLAO|nr:MBL fold metallo-hydrolase [Allomuricauda zhangzhouensis]SDQ26551.1 Glyoxylase, beta-lactamase superfamily II [Allomuricauda zhangzhouensis]SDW86214.1 Glyoxylase, beta-lactamase superfamily II [Allomuricauda zhangzhouensis]